MFLRYCLLFFAAIALPMAASPDAEQSGQQTVVSAQEGHKAEAHDGDHAATEPEEAVFNPNEMIMHHIADSHGWHIMDWNDKEIGIPLPVILWTREGLVVFSSSLFHHDIEGRHVAEAGGQRFINLHEKIYYASDAPNEHEVYAQADAATHEVANAKPWDISITKNVASLLVSVVIILVLFIRAARSYAKNGAAAPRGLAGFVEPLVVFVRDDIAKNNIGPHYKKFVPPFAYHLLLHLG